MRVVSWLAGRKRLVILAVVLIGGGVTIGVLGGAIGIPSVTSVDNTIGAVNDTTTVISTDLGIRNPNPIGASLGGLTVSYTIRMNDIEMAHGDRTGITIEQGNTSLALNTSVRNEKIPEWWVTHIEAGERSVLAAEAIIRSDRFDRRTQAPEVTHDIQTDIIGAFASEEDRPVNADQPLVSDPVLIITETRANWGAVSAAETPIEMVFRVHNPNSEPVVISSVGYQITMNTIAVGEGEIEGSYVIPPGGTEEIALTTRIQNEHLDEWWVSHLDPTVHGHQVSEFRIAFSAVLDLSGFGLGTTRVPLEHLTYTEMVRTDLFDEGLHDSDSTQPPTPVPTEDDEPPSTPPAATATSTTTPTPTPTPTEDDDGLVSIT